MTAPAEEAPAKKPFEKRYKTTVPVVLPAGMVRPRSIAELLNSEGHPDVLTARWLARESFEKLAADDRLQLVDYQESLVDPADVPTAITDALGRPADDYLWFQFSAVGRLDQAAFDYFAAEFVWKCDEWLAAERAYLTALDEHQGDNPGGD